MRTQPVGEPSEAGRLAAVELVVAAGVVADECLHIGRLILFDRTRELVAVLELELLATRLLHWHREDHPLLAGLAGDVGAVLLVDQKPRGLPARPPRERVEEAPPDEHLRR